MTTTHRRVLGAGMAATAIAALVAGTPAVAGAEPAQPGPKLTTVQLLSINDYHGNLEALPALRLPADVDPARTFAGGSENLATKLAALRTKAGDANSLTVAAGDLIGRRAA